MLTLVALVAACRPRLPDLSFISQDTDMLAWGLCPKICTTLRIVADQRNLKCTTSAEKVWSKLLFRGFKPKEAGGSRSASFQQASDKTLEFLSVPRASLSTICGC